jgi:hypothetical protein
MLNRNETHDRLLPGMLAALVVSTLTVFASLAHAVASLALHA